MQQNTFAQCCFPKLAVSSVVRSMQYTNILVRTDLQFLISFGLHSSNTKSCIKSVLCILLNLIRLRRSQCFIFFKRFFFQKVLKIFILCEQIKKEMVECLSVVPVTEMISAVSRPVCQCLSPSLCLNTSETISTLSTVHPHLLHTAGKTLQSPTTL